MKRIHLSFLAFFFSASVFATEIVKKKDVKFDFSGFFKYEVMFDSRQTVNAREGNFMLYPEKPFFDTENRDINALSSFNMCTINSMLKLNIIGPEILGAKSTAYFESDFWGSETNKLVDLNHLRLRHAFLKLDWNKTELLIGQFWHPMCVTGFFPQVVSSNCGVPFHPISRNPQIRLTYKLGKLKLAGYLFSQRDFTSTGPEGPDSEYLRNSGIPNCHFQLQLGTDSSKVRIGTGIDYKNLIPELYTTDEDIILKTGKENSLPSLSYVGFVGVSTKLISIRAQGIYAKNAYDMLMLGGYAVKKSPEARFERKEFSNLNTLSIWGDIQTTGNKIRLGLFTGYTKNMGSRDILDGPIYARGADIKDVYRIAPRIVYMNQSVEISLEGECTTGNYGIVNGNKKGGVTDTDPVSNFRSLLSFKYSF